MSPFLFYRPCAEGIFCEVARQACEELISEQRLSAWCIVPCGIKYLTKDGRYHSVEEYAEVMESRGMLSGLNVFEDKL
jgi:hypothetical protein